MQSIFTSSGSKKKNVYEELGGFGNDSKSSYSAGTYRVELWGEDGEVKMVFDTTVQLK